MKTERAIGVIVLTAAAAYVVWRLQEAQGGVIVWVNPLTLLSPGNPSPGGPEGSGGTNPIAASFRTTGPAFKRSGNAPAIGSKPAKPGSDANPIAPPSEITRTAQPARPAFLGENVRYLPNLGDPNMTSWDYLASTPPELSWGLTAGGGFFGV